MDAPESVSKGSFYGWFFNVTSGEASDQNVSWLSKAVTTSYATIGHSCSKTMDFAASWLGLKLDPNKFETAIAQGAFPEDTDVKAMLSQILEKGHLCQFHDVIETIHKKCPDKYSSLYSALFALCLDAGCRFPAESGFANKAGKLLIKMIHDENEQAACLHAACSFQYPELALKLIDQVSLNNESAKEAALSLFDLLITKENEQKMDPIFIAFGKRFIDAELIKNPRKDPVYNFVIGAERLAGTLPSKIRSQKQNWLREYRRSRYAHIPGKAPYEPAPTEWFPSGLQTTLWLSQMSASKQKEDAKFDTVILATQTSDTSTTRPTVEQCFGGIQTALDYPSSKSNEIILSHFLDFFSTRVDTRQSKPQWSLMGRLFEMLESQNKEVFFPLYERIFCALLLLPAPGNKKESEDLAIWLIKKHLVRGSQKLALIDCYPLHLAVRKQYWNLTELLLTNNKLDVLAKDNEGHTAFYYLGRHRDDADFNPTGETEIINTLAETMADRLPNREKKRGNPMADFERIVQRELKTRTSIREMKEWREAYQSLPSSQAISLFPDLMLYEYWKPVRTQKSNNSLIPNDLRSTLDKDSSEA